MAKSYRRLYLGRPTENPNEAELSFRKKGWSERRGFDDTSVVDTFCLGELERVTGVTLAPGEIRKVSIEIKFLD